MTDQAMADEIYLEPLTVETVKRIIKKERPDSILAGLGGQTGLTLAMQLDKEAFSRPRASAFWGPTQRPSPGRRTGSSSRRPWRRSASR